MLCQWAASGLSRPMGPAAVTPEAHAAAGPPLARNAGRPRPAGLNSGAGAPARAYRHSRPRALGAEPGDTTSSSAAGPSRSFKFGSTRRLQALGMCGIIHRD